MAFATRLTKIGYHSEHFNERTWMGYHQAPPWERVVAHVRDAGQAKPHHEHNLLSFMGAYNATPIQKLNAPERKRGGATPSCLAQPQRPPRTQTRRPFAFPTLAPTAQIPRHYQG